MAMAPPPVPNLPLGYVFRPKARELIQHYLAPKALGGYFTPGLVAEGVDVFSAAPDALPFSRGHRRENGEVWGYFFAAHPAGERAPAPGGCWITYGPEKAYRGGTGGEAVAFRRNLAYYVAWRGGEGGGDGVWARTPWLMAEYRLNKGGAAFRCARPGPEANMDCVVRKVFMKPAVPPPPARSSDDESAGSSSRYRSADEEAGYPGEEQARKRARWV
ncbi:hypothetical protein CFC21_024140 [Triticum aestivum]|uniref:NAC domain-containing protein n=3 Tax=Triticum TaxID=4564 RepID=A0A9R1PU67_TRITD|nr:NAC transcription factor 56-like [Triticum aestivum]KAF7009626.1 hypothetical protein CFC21_024140 [Triticum aestivum]VAH48728.1 unnamed protein product [Triticum turgidum subsp. durum]